MGELLITEWWELWNYWDINPTWPWHKNLDLNVEFGGLGLIPTFIFIYFHLFPFRTQNSSRSLWLECSSPHPELLQWIIWNIPLLPMKNSRLIPAVCSSSPVLSSNKFHLGVISELCIFGAEGGDQFTPFFIILFYFSSWEKKKKIQKSCWGIQLTWETSCHCRWWQWKMGIKLHKIHHFFFFLEFSRVLSLLPSNAPCLDFPAGPFLPLFYIK